MTKNKEFVKFDNVDKSYDGKVLVVKGLNLDIEEGEFVTMLGPSGSGKTTCLMMLAGFETFKTNNSDEPEFEDSSVRKNKSEDHDIIQQIASSYFETFNKHLPHPKQDNLIRVLFDGIKTSQKSLVFVRRIASVIELERKLTNEVENWHYSKIKKYFRGNPRLKQLQVAFKERHIITEIEDVLNSLSAKIYEYYKRDFDYLYVDEETNVQLKIHEFLFEIYNLEDSTSDLNKFRELVKDHIRLLIIKSDLRELSKNYSIGIMVCKRESKKLKRSIIWKLQKIHLVISFQHILVLKGIWKGLISESALQRRIGIGLIYTI